MKKILIHARDLIDLIDGKGVVKRAHYSDVELVLNEMDEVDYEYAGEALEKAFRAMEERDGISKDEEWEEEDENNVE